MKRDITTEPNDYEHWAQSTHVADREKRSMTGKKIRDRD